MSPKPGSVVLVHGLWMNGFELHILSRRLQALGYDVHRFTYHTVSASLDENARALCEFVARLEAPVVHLVGHSLGGLVILRLDERYADLPPGRRLLLGSPVGGSLAAEALARHGWGRRILGRCVAEGVLNRPRWQVRGREIGIIAGSLGVGLGRLFATLDGPHDGSVAVTETMLPEAAAHRVVPLSHMSLLFSREVAVEVAHFLELGRFA